MAKSPITSKVDLPTCTIMIEGTEINQAYGVMSIYIEKAINMISFARVVINDGDPAVENFKISESADFEPGKLIKIKLGYHSTETVAFDGVITAQKIKVVSYEHKVSSQLIISCYDKAVKLKAIRKSDNFKDKKDSEVISSIISNAGNLTSAVTETTYSHGNLIQYNCTDWDFLLARADANGMIVINEAAKLTVEKPVFSGDGVLDINYGSNVIDFQGELDSRYQATGAEYQSWDGTLLKLSKGTGVEPATVEPAINAHGNITGKKLSEVLGSPKQAITTSAPEDASLLKAWADFTLLRSRLAKIRGSVTFVGSTDPVPGKLINLEGFGARFNGKAYISSVIHELSEGFWKTTVGFGLDQNMHTDRLGISGGGAMNLLPEISGLHIGTVKKIDADPKGEYRVQVDIPFVEDSGDGIWARLTHPYASADVGMYFYPEVGDEVILGFLNSDPRFGVIVGSLYGKKNKPPYTPDSTNKDKAIVTKSKLKITFNDTDKTIVIETPGGQKATLDDKSNSVKIEDSNNNSIKLDKDGITLDSGKDIKLVASGKVSITPTGNAEIKATGDVSLAGNNVKAKANIGATIEGTATAELKASGQVTVKGAIVMIN